jgi:hypothetical protein
MVALPTYPVPRYGEDDDMILWRRIIRRLPAPKTGWMAVFCFGRGAIPRSPFFCDGRDPRCSPPARSQPSANLQPDVCSQA